MSRPPAQMNGKRRTRRSAEATRELMLNAGARLAVQRLQDADDDAAARALAHIRLTEVAAVATEIEAEEHGERNGRITTGAIYQFWPSQAAFQADLMVHILTSGLPSEQLAIRALELIATGGEAESIMAELADIAHSSARANENHNTALLFVPYHRLPRVAEALRKNYRDEAEALRPIYQALLRSGRLRIRAPWQLADMMVAISSLHEGFGIQTRADPRIVETRRGRSVIAEATVAIFRAFTEPA